MDKDRSLGDKVCNKVTDFIYDNINDFLIGKFNDFIYAVFIINNIIFSYSKSVIEI